MPRYLDPIREAQAVAALKQYLAGLAPNEDDEDARLLADCIEGETSFLEMVDGLLELIADAEALADAASERIERLEARRARFLKRMADARALLAQALEVAGEKKIERPGGTLSLRVGTPKVVVTDEAAIPDRYWRWPPRVLDKRLLGEDLKDRRAANERSNREPLPDIPGATLSNGPPVLSIRQS